MDIRENLTKKHVVDDVELADYRLMFDSSSGQKVLAHLLYEMHFIEEIESPEEMARRNVLVRMLHHAGIFREENLTLLATKLLEVARIGGK